MTRFTRWSFNDQNEVLGKEENFRRFVCEELDNIESEAMARFAVSTALLVVLLLVAIAILWRVW